MPNQDAERWNSRYTEEKLTASTTPRPFLVDHTNYLPSQGLAFDVAMGLGINAGFLIGRGLHVLGVDISEVAVRRAKLRFPQIWAVVADVRHFVIPPNTFDVIVNFLFLERGLWRNYIQALKPGGFLFFETLMVDMLQIRTDLNPAHLLHQDELRLGFSELEILDYREGWVKSETGHSRAVASLLGRKPFLLR